MLTYIASVTCGLALWASGHPALGVGLVVLAAACGLVSAWVEGGTRGRVQ